jgi:hypothetical protein
MTNLVVAPCDIRAARHAIMRWHYSKTVPAGKLVKFGVWENKQFIGAVIFGRGATPHLGRPYQLQQTELCELVRVALDEHQAPVTQIVAEAIRQLKQTNPGLRLIVSFADPDEGHHGGIYQAGNWVYNGSSPSARFFKIKGKKTHPRSVGAMGGVQSLEWVQANLDSKAEIIVTAPKLRYLYPLDKPMRRKIAKLALPYENAVEGLEASHLDSVEEVLVQSQPTALGEN